MTDHVTYPSVEAMLEPAVLADLLGRPVGSVTVTPMETAGWSSTEAVFEAVHVDGGTAPAAVLKRIRWSANWMAIASQDTVGRELAIWETGVLDRLPPEMGHAVLAVARFQGGAALLMDDLSHHLIPDGAAVTIEQELGILDSMAAMHATFFEDPPVAELGPALYRVDRLLTALGPTNLRALSRILPDSELISMLSDAWDRLPDLVDAGVARDLRALADDPTPIVAALDSYPKTLLHGDLRDANVALDGTRTVAFDWQPIVAPPGLELAWFVQTLGVASPLHPDEAMARYREMLADRLGPDVYWAWWDDHLDICIAAMKVVTASLDVVLRDQEYDPRIHPHWTSHEWWVERSMRGLRLIDAA